MYNLCVTCYLHKFCRKTFESLKFFVTSSVFVASYSMLFDEITIMSRCLCQLCWLISRNRWLSIQEIQWSNQVLFLHFSATVIASTFSICVCFFGMNRCQLVWILVEFTFKIKLVKNEKRHSNSHTHTQTFHVGCECAHLKGFTYDGCSFLFPLQTIRSASSSAAESSREAEKKPTNFFQINVCSPF